MLSAAAAATLIGCPGLAQTPPAPGTLPAGEILIGSSAATFDRSVADTLTVNQSGARALIDWTSFDIAADSCVAFNQPGADSVALNRVTGGDPTNIHGQLSANGVVGVLNPNGVYFDGDAIVDVGGLIATTGNIADQSAFLAGGALAFSGAANGQVAVGAGAAITVSHAGLAAFVAPHVINNGIIDAVAGRVVLAAGETFTLDLGGDGLLALGLGHAALLVESHGDIFAQGGVIRLSAAAAADLVGSIINTGGLEVRTADMTPDGVVVLEAGHTTVQLAGPYDADFRISNRLGLGGGLTLRGDAATIDGKLSIVGHAPAGSVIDGVTIEGLTINAKAGEIGLIAESNSADGVYNTRNLIVRDVAVRMNGQHALGLFDVDGAVFDNVVIEGDGSAFYGVEAIGLKGFAMTGGAIRSARIGVNIWALAGYEANGGVTFSGVDFADNRTHLRLDGAGAGLTALLAANSFDRTIHATGGSAIYGDLPFAIADTPAGGALNLGAGVFEGGAVLNKAGLSIVGAGAGATKVRTGATGRGFTIAANNVSISNLGIEGQLDVPHYLKLDWDDTSIPAAGRLQGNYGIYVQQNLTGFQIANIAITNVRTGIGVFDNAQGSITGNFIENTKGAMLLRSGGAGVISGNTQGVHGNEWGVVLNLANISIGGGAGADRQAEILALSHANHGMSVLDRHYGAANRTHVFVDAASTATAVDDFNFGNALGNRRQALTSIQAGLNAVVSGGFVDVRNGTYTLTSRLDIARPVTLRGESRAGVTINAAASGYGMFVTADDVTLSGFTFQANDTASSPSSRYGVKVQPDTGARDDLLRNFAISDVTIRGFGGSELDLNGVRGATIQNATLDGQGTKGVGLAIADSRDVTVSNVTTQNNLWGAIALYHANIHYDQNLGNITVNAAGSSFGEDLGLFLQSYSGVHAQPGQLTLNGFTHAVRNTGHRADGNQFTFFRAGFADALAFALGLAAPGTSSIEDWTGTTYSNVFTVTGGLAVASAVRDARTGGTVNLAAGTYSGPVTLDKGLTLNGAGMTSTVLTGGMTMTGAIGGLTLKNFTVRGDGGGNMVIRNNGAITGLTMDRVRIDGQDAAGRHGFAGGTIGGAIVITNSEFLNIDGWAAFDTRSGAGTDQGSQIASALFSGNLLDNVQGHINFRQDAAGAFPDVTFSNNVVRNTGSATNSFGAIFKAFNARAVGFTGNTVSGVGTSGFNPSGEAAYGAVLMVRGASTLTVANNSFTGNRMVLAVEPGRGLPGVTTFTNNSFVNNGYVLYTPGSLTGGGAVNFGAGNTITSGANTVQHVVWRSAGALDMTQVRFDGALASSMTLDQQFALERLITHGVDIAEAGLVRTVAGRVFVTPSAGALTRGIALASGGDTIHVASGAYGESVASGKMGLSLAFDAVTLNSLSLTGAGTRLSGQIVADGGLSFGALTLTGALSLTSRSGAIVAGAVSGPYAFSAFADASDITLGALNATSISASGRVLTLAGATSAGAQTYTGTAVRLGGVFATGGGAFTVSGPAQLTGAASILSNGGDIALGSVNGAVAGVQAFGIDAGTGRAILGAVGAGTRLGALAINAGDITLGALNATSISVSGRVLTLAGATSAGAQTYTGTAVRLGGVFMTGGGAFTVSGPAQLTGVASILSNGGAIVAGAVSGPYAFSAFADAGDITLGALNATSISASGRVLTLAGATSAGAQTYAGTAVRLGGAFATGGGAFTVSGPAQLTGAASILSNGGDIALGSVNGAVAGAQALSIDAGTGRAILGAVGADTRLGALTVAAADTTLSGSLYVANSIHFIGEAVRLTAALTTFDTRQSAGSAGDITVTADLFGTANGAQSVAFIAGTGTSPNDGDIAIGNAGSDAVRLGAMSVTGGDFTAQTVKLAGDFISVLSGDQTFSAQTLDTLGGVNNQIAGSVSGPIVSGGSVTINAGGSSSSPITANGGVAISAGGSTSGQITSGGGVTIAAGGSTSGQITSGGGVTITAGGSSSGQITSGGGVTIIAGGSTSGQITSGGQVAITARGAVSNTVDAGAAVNIAAIGPIVASVRTLGAVALTSEQRVDAQLTAGQVKVNAPSGQITGEFRSIETGQNGSFMINEQPTVGGGVDARRVVTDDFTVPTSSAKGARRTVRIPAALAAHVGALPESGEGLRTVILLNQVEYLGELLRHGYTALVMDSGGSGPAIEEEPTESESES